ncbi:histidinol-phosphate transaminase [Spongiactinospora gelatinilytica]|uniref:Histidinol-phosphate aminotransferase n=1 Tax=Spongiactinospora gelatinilytica TaxID=2666298 RepID=A0A2W2GSC5_9ACTN|nr:histidinol-phosphate transaminase [Spongiactinospora gelatinilytica]PZG50782.1 histidinol-phosphate transaminase [Spongiactinospora gelatinilytica]
MMSVILPRLRSVLTEVSGHRAAPAGPDNDRAPILLANNESPFGPLPSVVAAIAEAAGEVNRYPDYGVAALTADIAAWLGVETDQVAVGCGSVGVLQMLFQAAGEPGTDIVHAWRSFDAYPTLAKLAGLRPVTVPLQEERHDLAAMADAITPDTRIVVVCNPNNPTGTTVRDEELKGFLDRVPRDCLVVLDEAYHEYVRDPGVPDGLGLLAAHPNVVVVRTFSKAFGLAGLRVGYLVGHPAVAAEIRKTRLPYTVSHLAQVAARASLRAHDELMARVDQTIAERERVRAALLAHGVPVAPSEANFVWAPLQERTAAFAAACAAENVHVRAYPGDGVRVTIGLPEAGDAFLKLIGAL